VQRKAPMRLLSRLLLRGLLTLRMAEAIWNKENRNRNRKEKWVDDGYEDVSIREGIRWSMEIHVGLLWTVMEIGKYAIHIIFSIRWKALAETENWDFRLLATVSISIVPANSRYWRGS
jgi:hypothetical protein